MYSRFNGPKRAWHGRCAALLEGLALAGLLSVLPTPLLAGGNLIENSEFSNFTIAPWRAEQGTALLSNVDHADNLDSGSALVSDPGANGLLSLSFQYGKSGEWCVVLQGDATMASAGFFKAGTRNPSGSKFRIRHFYYGDRYCTGSTAIPATPSGTSGYVASPSNWVQSSYQYTAPANAQSMLLIIEVKSGVDTSTFDLYVDDVTLTSSGDTPPPPPPPDSTLLKDGFEDELPGSWTSIVQ